jgi:hypothetical protein
MCEAYVFFDSNPPIRDSESYIDYKLYVQYLNAITSFVFENWPAERLEYLVSIADKNSNRMAVPILVTKRAEWRLPFSGADPQGAIASWSS